jgi:hypothetical protein
MGFFADRPGAPPRPRPDDAPVQPYAKKWERQMLSNAPTKRRSSLLAKMGRDKPMSLSEKIRHALQCK